MASLEMQPAVENPQEEDARNFVDEYGLQNLNIGAADGKASEGVDAHVEELSSHEIGDISLEEQVFGKYMILKRILKNLTIRDLLKCRLVNTEWKSISNKFINPSKRLTFFFDEDSMTYETHEEKKCLTDLTDFLESSGDGREDFPCTTFQITGGPLNHPDVQRFLTVFGAHVTGLILTFYKSLEVGIVENPPTIDDLKKLLTTQLPKAKTLNIVDWPSIVYEKGYLCQLPLNPEESSSKYLISEVQNKNKKDILNPYQIQLKSKSKSRSKPKPLSNLDTFCFIPQSSKRSPPRLVPTTLIEDILELAPNLKQIEWNRKVHEDKLYLPFLVEIKKTNLVRHLNLNKIHFIPQVIRSFVDNCEPCIERIVFPEITPQKGYNRLNSITSVINKILRRCSKTLRILDMDPVGLLWEVVFPVLPRLRWLELHRTEELPTPDREANPNANYSFFPEKLVLSQTFPNLKCFRSMLKFKPSGDSYRWEEFFNETAAKDLLPSVNQLDFDYLPPIQWLSNCSLMFPNVKKLVLKMIKDISVVMDIVYRLTKLSIVEITIDATSEENRYPAMDAAFTGYSKEISRELFRGLIGDVDDSEKRFFRRANKSLLDLPDLRDLRIKLIHNPQENGDELEGLYDEPLMSPICGLFAFRMCPKLRVQLWLVAADDEIERLMRAAGPVFPYVFGYSTEGFRRIL